jgi:hypothetical protein
MTEPNKVKPERGSPAFKRAEAARVRAWYAKGGAALHEHRLAAKRAARALQREVRESLR